MSGYQFQCEDAVMPISDTFGELATNAVLYNVVSGCAVTPSASDLTVATAAGLITGFGAVAAVTAAPTAWTLIPDASNPRWAWLAYGLTGTPAIVQGDPAVIPTVPELGDRVANMLYYEQAALTIAANATYQFVQRVPAPEQKHLHNYTTATQTVSASTTFVDVIGAAITGSATSKFSFDAEASTKYLVTFHIPFIVTGTGGAKFQITGPASPTALTITGAYAAGDAGLLGAGPFYALTPVAAFSTAIADFAANGNGGGTTWTAAFQQGIDLTVLLRNGTTAGAVTLQVAQHAANGSVVLGIGATMDVVRLG